MPKHFYILVLLLISCSLQSKPIAINVIDHEGSGVANVVVYLTPKNPSSDIKDAEVAVMDQVNTQFSPHILAIQKNTMVRFPNSDSIKHHVYSFSPAKTFELQLYKELAADPLLFSKEGPVELGCNIHDWMLGYVFVVDTPYFGKSDAQGNVTLKVPDGEYQVDVWHPRIQDELSALTKTLNVPQKPLMLIELNKPMLLDVNQYENTLDEFSDYE